MKPPSAEAAGEPTWICCWCHEPLDTSTVNATDYEYCPHCRGRFSFGKPVVRSAARGVEAQERKEQADRMERTVLESLESPLNADKVLAKADALLAGAAQEGGEERAMEDMVSRVRRMAEGCNHGHAAMAPGVACVNCIVLFLSLEPAR